MPVATLETKSIQIDDDLTDLSWLVQMNSSSDNTNHKQRYSTANEFHSEQKNKKFERKNKPFAIVNGQTIRPSLPLYSHDHQYFNDENQYYVQQSSSNQPIKRKFDSSLSYHHPTKRVHSEQILPVYPTPPESYYYDQPILPTSIQQHQQRPSLPITSRYMLLKNDPSLSDTVPTVQTPKNFNEPIKMIEHENIYSDDIEHLLDIFKNEVEMIGLDPIASTSAGDCTLDMAHCLSSNGFFSY